MSNKIKSDKSFILPSIKTIFESTVYINPLILNKSRAKVSSTSCKKTQRLNNFLVNIIRFPPFIVCNFGVGIKPWVWIVTKSDINIHDWVVLRILPTKKGYFCQSNFSSNIKEKEGKAMSWRGTWKLNMSMSNLL